MISKEKMIEGELIWLEDDGGFVKSVPVSEASKDQLLKEVVRLRLLWRDEQERKQSFDEGVQFALKTVRAMSGKGD